MGTKTETYLLGMKAINSFFYMLYAAMQESMPGAMISKNGAYVWRGYRIDSYRELAYGQYYCQIYPCDNPEVLIFQESYIDASHKASAMEKERKIKNGQYYYPFRESDDLYRARFFKFTKEEQYAFLKSFVAGAAEKALIWQQSEARKKLTGTGFQKGNKPRRNPMKDALTYEQVGEEYLQVWTYQSEFFKKLENAMNQVSGKQWVRPNANIYNFGFRGLRLKTKSSSVTSRWIIAFEKPGLLQVKNLNVKPDPYDFVKRRFFDMSSEEQDRELMDFVQSSINQQANK